MHLDLKFIRRGIVVFWAIWFAIVLASNVCDALLQLHVLPATWRFHSGNYAFVHTTVARYQIPHAICAVLFAGVIAWELAATIMFFRAAVKSAKDADAFQRASRSAFAIGLGLWAAFILSDEVLIAYDVEATHLRLFVAQLVSLLFLELVSDNGAR